MARPVKYDLTGQDFGALRVLLRSSDSPPMWDCVCKCGNPNSVVLSTAQLRWGHRRDCGCGCGRDVKDNRGGRCLSRYALTPLLHDVIGGNIMAALGHPNIRSCTLCDLTPARNLVTAYGISDPRFRATREDPYAYLTLCGICYSAAKQAKYLDVQRGTPEQWFTFVTRILPGGACDKGDMRGLAKLLVANQTPEEATTTSGAAARTQAERLLQ